MLPFFPRTLRKSLSIYKAIKPLHLPPPHPRQIPGSPFNTQMVPEALSASYSTLSGPGIASAVMEAPSKVTVTSRDTNGNALRASAGADAAAQFRAFVFANKPPAPVLGPNQTLAAFVAAAGGAPVALATQDVGDGTYTLTYTAPASSSFYLLVAFQGVAVPSIDAQGTLL